MKYVLVIAIILTILFGFSAGANFVAIAFVGAMVISLIGSACMAISKFIKLEIVSAILWVVATAFWWWLLSICI